jgi:hypothetical protein
MAKKNRVHEQLPDNVIEIRDQPALRITDWKSGMGEEEDDLQLAIYALAGWKHRGFDRIRTGFYYFEKNGSYDYSDWDEHSLVGAFRFVDRVARQYIAEKVWPAKTNKWCGYCTLKGKCSEFTRMVVQAPTPTRFDIAPTKENGPAIIHLLSEIEAVAKASYKIQEDLKAKAKQLLEAGPIEVDGKVYSLTTYPGSYNYDLERMVVQATELLGAPPLQRLDPQATHPVVLILQFCPIDKPRNVRIRPCHR